jgi:hypothetical protein
MKRLLIALALTVTALAALVGCRVEGEVGDTSTRIAAPN